MVKKSRSGSVGKANHAKRNRRKPQPAWAEGASAFELDLPERRQAPEARRLSEEKFSIAFHGSMAGTSISRLRDGLIIDVNERWLELFGFRREEVIGKVIAAQAWRYPEERTQMVRDLQQWGAFRNRELHFVRTDGEEWIALTSARVRRLHGESVIISSSIDITDRKQMEEALQEANRRLQEQAEELQASSRELRMQTEDLAATNEALQESEERVHRIMRASPLGILVGDTYGRILEANDTYLRISGCTREELEAGLIRWDRMTPKEYLPRDVQAIAEAQETGVSATYEKEYLRSDGQRVPVLMAYATLGGKGQLAAFVLDITDRKHAEEALRESKNLLQADLDAMTRLQELGMLSVREKHLGPILTKILDAAIAVSGADFGNIQLLDPTTGDLTIVAQRGFPQWWLDFWNQVSKGRGTCGTALEHKNRVIVEDVEHSPIFTGPALEAQRKANVRAVQSTPLMSRSGNPLGMFSTHYKAPHRPDDRTLQLLDLLGRQAADMIEWAQADEALRASEERFRAFVTASSDVVYRMSPDWTEMRYLHGREFLPDTDRPSHTWLDKYIHPDDQPHVLAVIHEAIRTKSIFALEHRVLRVDGSLGWTFSRAVPLLDARGEIVEWLGAASDITERKRAEEALRELTATLESKVAERTTELLLRTRQLQKVMLELSQAQDRDRQRLAEMLRDDLQPRLAAAELHLGLLGQQVRDDASLREAVDQGVGLLQEALEQSRRLARELDPILLYRGDFSQVLDWLANQMQAKHGLTVRVQAHGAVEVSSDAVKTLLFRAAEEILFNIVKYAGVAEATVRLRRRRGWLWLGLRDRGRGFDPKTLKQTAGFGLASIRERVVHLGGRLKIRSAPGRGSTFLIALPDEEEPEDRGPEAEDGKKADVRPLSSGGIPGDA